MVDITFRTDGAWGPGKGSNLTPAEVDVNFYGLKLAVEDLQNNPPEPNQIANIVVSGSTLTVIMEDDTEFGPFDLPVAAFSFRGPWEAETAYFVNDLVVVDTALYLVVEQHLSPEEFDAEYEASSGGDFAYQLVLESFGGSGSGGAVVDTVELSFSPQLGDEGTYYRVEVYSPDISEIILPNNSDVAFEIGTELRFFQFGDQNVWVYGDSGVNVENASGFDSKTRDYGSVIWAKKVAANAWDVWGDLLPLGT